MSPEDNLLKEVMGYLKHSLWQVEGNQTIKKEYCVHENLWQIYPVHKSFLLPFYKKKFKWAFFSHLLWIKLKFALTIPFNESNKEGTDYKGTDTEKYLADSGLEAYLEYSFKLSQLSSAINRLPFIAKKASLTWWQTTFNKDTMNLCIYWSPSRPTNQTSEWSNTKVTLTVCLSTFLNNILPPSFSELLALLYAVFPTLVASVFPLSV